MGKILCIGTCSEMKRNCFTGQSVMFDGVVKHLKEYGKAVSVVDILFIARNRERRVA